ncbi:alpha/beta hydrolase [Phenylobacterium sp.]|uniref:alpha/beta hydrolase n=1 Tax=Phenylobacterium sp. TaxID=1871053 RepID=UPI0027300970|nr:alpha/beta hydrolase [Phenylobacterium sp.]MDP1874784.1 alpha/beta hydrolase [Phenylobacterium sp.]
MRPWLPLLAALALAACDSGGPRPALLDSRAPPGLAPRFLAPEGWAWGAVQPPDGPELRYGVTAPPGTGRRAEVLILPDSDEPAEVWFETAAALNAAGYVVWTLEWEGFGGSGRPLPPYDMIHAQTAGAGANAVAALISQVIRPSPDRPLTLMASGDSATVALAALQGNAPVGAAILSAPRLTAAQSQTPWEGLAVRAGLSRLPSPDWRPWSRSDSAQAQPPGADPWRGRLIHSWRLANPDLRQSGQSLGWRATRSEAHAGGVPQLSMSRPLLILAAQAEGIATADTCRTEQGCRLAIQPQFGSAPHLSLEAVRAAWLTEVTTFLDEQIPPTAPAARDDGGIE